MIALLALFATIGFYALRFWLKLKVDDLKLQWWRRLGRALFRLVGMLILIIAGLVGWIWFFPQ